MFRLATFCGFGALLIAWMAYGGMTVDASSKGTGTGGSSGKGKGTSGTGMGGSHPAGKGGKSTGGTGTGTGTSAGTGYPGVGVGGTATAAPSPFSIPPLTAEPKSDNKPAVPSDNKPAPPSIAVKLPTSIGKVQSLSSDNKELTILDKDGKEQKFKLDAGAKIKLNDKDAEVGDIRDKDDATITYEKKDDTLVAKEILLMRK